MLHFNHSFFFFFILFSVCLLGKEIENIWWRCVQAVPGRLLSALLDSSAKVRVTLLFFTEEGLKSVT